MTEPESRVDFFENAVPDATALLDRPRLERPPLIPRWVPIAAAVSIAVLVVMVVGVIFITGVAQVTVPKLVGLELGVAKSRASAQRLEVSVSERRFSSLPIDTIIEQSPAAGAKLRRGQSINVVVSAGTEDFAMPDVVGDGILLARGVLEKKGLQVRVEAEPSDQPSGTVLATNPSPGVKVRTGSVVRVTVASQSVATTAGLQPMNMRGISVIIDPAVAPAGLTDVSFEVSRKLSSLIKASGGTVLMTRSSTDTGTTASDSVRARRAQEGSSTVAVGLTVAGSGERGLVAQYPLIGETSILEPSRTLANSIAKSLVTNGGLQASASTTPSDTVLGSGKTPWSRVRLGSASSPEDRVDFADPKWSDTVARAIYQALAEIYGVKGATN